MAADENMLYQNKLKLLHLMEIFKKYTDAEHGLSHAELQAKLRERGLIVNDRTLRDDLLALHEYMVGTEMELTDNIKREEGKETARPIRYMLNKRLFTTTEVKLIMESVRGVHSLSDKQTEVLLKKLETLCSAAEAEQIRSEFAIMGGFKAYWHNGIHDVLLNNIELIDQALRQKKRIRFRYFWFNMNKEPTYSRDSKKKHVVSPLARVYEDGFYYLIALDEDDYYRHYRLDRMTDVSVTIKRRSNDAETNKTDWVKYVNAHFGMLMKIRFKKKRPHPAMYINSYYYQFFDVKMRFTRDLVGVVLDRFGQDVWIHREDKGHFTANFRIQYNPQFVEWVLGMGSKVKVIKPDFMHRDICRYAKAMWKWHDLRDPDGEPGA